MTIKFIVPLQNQLTLSTQMRLNKILTKSEIMAKLIYFLAVTLLLKATNGSPLTSIKVNAVRIQKGIKNSFQRLIGKFSGNQSKRTDSELKSGIAKFYDEVGGYEELHHLFFESL